MCIYIYMNMVTDFIVATYVATSPLGFNEKADGKKMQKNIIFTSKQGGLAQNLHSVLVLGNQAAFCTKLTPQVQAGGLSIAAQRLEDAAPLRSHGSQRACLAVGRSST